MTTVEDTFSEIVRAEEDTAMTVELAGQTFTVVANPKAGALLILMRRLDDKEMQVQMGATVRLLEKWIIPADHDRLFTAIEDVADVKSFMEGDFAQFIERVTSRPTWAPAS